MYAPPPDAPTNLYEAFAYIGTVRQPSIDDLKLMLLLGAAGKLTDFHFSVSFPVSTRQTTYNTTSTPRSRRYSLTSRMRKIRKWNTEAASSIVALPFMTAS